MMDPRELDTVRILMDLRNREYYVNNTTYLPLTRETVDRRWLIPCGDKPGRAVCPYCSVLVLATDTQCFGCQGEFRQRWL